MSKQPYKSVFLAESTELDHTRLGSVVRTSARLIGAAAVAAGLLALGAPAFADMHDNDGVNIGNDNNISLVPIQACGNNVAVLGITAPIASPQNVQCVNAPILDHPKSES